MLTGRLRTASRRLVASILRVDIGAIAGLRPTASDEEGVTSWIEKSVVAFEFAVFWMVVWLVAHLGLLLVGSTAFHWVAAPIRVVVPVEVIPGGMFAVSVVRLGFSYSQLVRVVKAVGDARTTGTQPPSWTGRGGIFEAVMTFTDRDLAIAVCLVLVVELVVH